ncbi:maker233 [Drosophila busckii]|uniref:Maker233 n=1 Tax=Drosophila busckii TaxID=30019 RepID=A0A0M4EVT2_DROBS|nr:uncharacterized protein LOC108602603 [Drosophila busckii]ALC47505.1 maker233 [Drosophila busckii]
MSIFLSNELNACEEGQCEDVDTKDLRSAIHEESVSIRQVIKAAFLVIFFNMCLIGFGVIYFMYSTSLDQEQRSRLNDITCSMIGGILIVVLYFIGDLSKNNPHFYYI